MDVGTGMYLRPNGRAWTTGPALVLMPCLTSRLLNIGYGRIQSEIMDGLEAAGGIKLIPETAFGWDYRLFFGWPRSWWFAPGASVEAADFSDIIIHTMFESEKPPGGWVDVMNHARLIWTPSEWCKGLFQEWGVTRPIMVAGYGVNTDDFPIVQRYDDAPFTFAAFSHDLMDRKGGFNVFMAFCKLKMAGEIPDARLLIKIQRGMVNEKWLFDENGEQRKVWGPDGKEITGITYHFGTLPQVDYALLMGQAHILVYPQRGEGFGLIPLEFAASGGAVMVTDYSGCKEYTDPRQMIVLPEVVDEETLMAKMVWAYEHRIKVREMGESAAQWVRANWSWEIAGLKARKLLYENLGK